VLPAHSLGLRLHGYGPERAKNDGEDVSPASAGTDAREHVAPPLTEAEELEARDQFVA
jgi:hypothetical protein